MPFEVVLEHAFPCVDVAQAESTLHQRFAAMRTNGEWFVLEPEDLNFLKRIGRMRGADIEFGEAVVSWDSDGKYATYHLSERVLEELENLRHLLRVEMGVWRSKSEIVEAALRRAVEGEDEQALQKGVSKKNATFYLSAQVQDRLERRYVGLRKEGRMRVSKSEMVEAALNRLIKDANSEIEDRREKVS